MGRIMRKKLKAEMLKYLNRAMHLIPLFRQPMKSANGFGMNIWHPLELFIRWREKWLGCASRGTKCIAPYLNSCFSLSAYLSESVKSVVKVLREVSDQRTEVRSQRSEI